MYTKSEQVTSWVLHAEARHIRCRTRVTSHSFLSSPVRGWSRMFATIHTKASACMRLEPTKFSWTFPKRAKIKGLSFDANNDTGTSIVESYSPGIFWVRTLHLSQLVRCFMR